MSMIHSLSLHKFMVSLDCHFFLIKICTYLQPTIKTPHAGGEQKLCTTKAPTATCNIYIDGDNNIAGSCWMQAGNHTYYLAVAVAI